MMPDQSLKHTLGAMIRLFLKLAAATQKLLFKKLNLRELCINKLLSSIEGLEYVILKSDTPYMPSNFPDSYPIGKDLDILTSQSDYPKAVSHLHKFKEDSHWKHGIKIINTEKRIKIRFMWFGLLHYQIDCAYDLGLNGLEQELLNRRESLGLYYTPNREAELLYRYLEYQDDPQKKHHLSYINQYREHWNSTLDKRYKITRNND